MVTATTVANLKTEASGHGKKIFNPPVTGIVPHPFKGLVCCSHGFYSIICNIIGKVKFRL